MAKNRNKPRPPQDEAGQGGQPAKPPRPDNGEPRDRPTPWVRGLLSLLLAWHVFVVFIWPMGIDLSSTSTLVAQIARSRPVRWYSQPLYLDHGYHFFGPDPPINQLVRYRVTDSQGAVVAEGELPNKEEQWPRLYYHRHMMLADQAGNGPGYVAPRDWLQFSMRAYGRHLLRRHGGERVAVDYVRHLPLSPSQVRLGADPNAPEFFEPVLSVDVAAAELDQPLPIPAPPEPQRPQPEALPPGAPS